MSRRGLWLAPGPGRVSGRRLLAAPGPEGLPFAPESESFRSWGVTPTAFILQREGGRFGTCRRAAGVRLGAVRVRWVRAGWPRGVGGGDGMFIQCAQRKAVISLLGLAVVSTRPRARKAGVSVCGV